MEVASKEDHLLRMKNDLDWAEGRVERLEVALLQATAELKKRTEMYEKWEYKAGDQQQQISEMERIRKALTVQIHGLRQEIGPKEEKLLLISEKLQEMDREYDLALQAVSEKEIALARKNTSFNMLQKQVRDLRSVSANKDASLRRAALLFEQYRQTLDEVHTHTGAHTGHGGGKDSGHAGGSGSNSNGRDSGNNGGTGFMSANSTFNGKQMSALQNKNQGHNQGQGQGHSQFPSPVPSRMGTQKLNNNSFPLKKDPGSTIRTHDENVHRSDNDIALQRLHDVLRPHLVSTTSTNMNTSGGLPELDVEVKNKLLRIYYEYSMNITLSLFALFLI